tara:strand:+ start:2253 stop:2399 length:147 start_codon:yes stop_codon:yes gene_type:complete
LFKGKKKAALFFVFFFVFFSFFLQVSLDFNNTNNEKWCDFLCFGHKSI